MEFVCFTDWEQLPASVDQLFAQTEKESVFFSRPWFENLIQNGLEEGQSVAFGCVLDGDRVLAMLPLSWSERGHFHSLKNLYSSLSTLLLDNDQQQGTLACLVDGLRQLPVKYLQLDPVAEDDPNMDSLQQAFSSIGYSWQRHFRFYNWIHRTAEQSYADYLAARPTRVRNTIARKSRKLEREHGYHVRLFNSDNVQQGLTDYHTVYNASWKAKELFTGFVEGLAEAFAKRDWLRLAVLYIENRPVAAQFWFVAHGKASIFKLAYDDAWRRYSPGTILTAHLMEHVIDVDRVSEIDFLTGNDAYKQEWMSERRQRERLCFFRTDQPQTWTTRLGNPVSRLVKRLKLTRYNPFF